MNVYDFDNTLLKGDSTGRFIGYCFLHFPRLWPDIPAQLVNALLFALRLRPKQAFKQRFLSIMRYFPDPESTIEAFWKKNIGHIKPFYFGIRQPDDVIISASPEFLIGPACRQLGIRNVIGSPVDPRTGVFNGRNCQGAEKVRRFYERFPDGVIDRFYSDSLSDTPLAELAKEAVLVKGERLLPWPKRSR